MDIKNLKNYFKYSLIIFIIIGIIFVGIYFLYYNKIKESFKTNNEINYNSENDKKEAKVCFFYVDWCPHCKTALPEWNKFKDEMNGTHIKDYKIHCVEYNCTSESAEITKLINKYNIEGYPTIKLIKDNEVYDFDAKPTYNYLKQFCYTMI
jgi:thiol-disulfide isomerase/thioredoxin